MALYVPVNLLKGLLVKNCCALDAGFSRYWKILVFPMVKFLNFEMEKIAFINLKLLYTLGWSEENVNLNLILNRNNLWENIQLFSHNKLQLIFLWIFTCKNFFALGRTFQNLGKTLKICLPSTPYVSWHLQKGCISFDFITVTSLVRWIVQSSFSSNHIPRNLVAFLCARFLLSILIVGGWGLLLYSL